MSQKLMNTKIADLVLKEKPVNILLEANKRRNTHISFIQRHVKCTYGHTVRVLEVFERRGLVTFEKRSKYKIVKITKKGEEIAGLIDQLKTIK